MLQGRRFAFFFLYFSPSCFHCPSDRPALLRRRCRRPGFQQSQLEMFCPSPPIRTRREYCGKRTSSAALRLIAAFPLPATLRLITLVFFTGLVSPGLKTFSGSSQLRLSQHRRRSDYSRPGRRRQTNGHQVRGRGREGRHQSLHNQLLSWIDPRHE